MSRDVAHLEMPVEPTATLPQVALVADGDSIYRRMLEALLRKWGYTVEAVQDGYEALRRLESSDKPQLAILDWTLPGVAGPEVCRRLRRRAESSYLYLLLLSSANGNGDVIEGLNSGADDYLAKPFRIEELEARLRTGQRILNLQAALLATQESLRIQASQDALTGLLNRRAILQALTDELSRAARERSPLGLILIDLDHFKKVNDEHGHLAGDAVLRETGLRIGNALRTYDRVGRYGGEELLVVLPNCDELGAQNVAERIRREVCARPIPSGTTSLTVTISAGAVVVKRFPVKDPLALLKRADDALYVAKQAGRNRVELAP